MKKEPHRALAVALHGGVAVTSHPGDPAAVCARDDEFMLIRSMSSQSSTQCETRRIVQHGPCSMLPTRRGGVANCDPAAGLNEEFCVGVDCRDPGALPPDQERCCHQVEPAIQERAWTSPIWYQPPG